MNVNALSLYLAIYVLIQFHSILSQSNNKIYSISFVLTIGVFLFTVIALGRLLKIHFKRELNSIFTSFKIFVVVLKQSLHILAHVSTLISSNILLLSI